MTQTYGTRQAEFGFLFAEWQVEIVEINHAEALMMNEARGSEVVTVTASGLRITRATLDAEIAAARAPRTPVQSGSAPLVIGLNASSNMFA